jgi:hypothetical protein
MDKAIVSPALLNVFIVLFIVFDGVSVGQNYPATFVLMATWGYECLLNAQPDKRDQFKMSPDIKLNKEIETNKDAKPPS